MPNSWNGVYPNKYQVLSEDGERVLWRAWGLGDGGSREFALVVLPAAERPSRLSLDRLTHEFGLKDELDEAWAVRPLELGARRRSGDAGARGSRRPSSFPKLPSRWIEMAPAPKDTVCLAATKLKDFICAASRHLKILSQHRPQRAAERSVVCAKSRAGSARLSGT